MREVSLRRVYETIVAVEKQWVLHIFSVCVCVCVCVALVNHHTSTKHMRLITSSSVAYRKIVKYHI
jgi:hypothetical protein